MVRGVEDYPSSWWRHFRCRWCGLTESTEGRLTRVEDGVPYYMYGSTVDNCNGCDRARPYDEEGNCLDELGSGPHRG